MSAFDQIVWGSGVFGGSGGPSPAAIHVSDLIYAAARMVGLITDAQRGLSASQQTDSLAALLGMVDSWKIEKFLGYAEKRTVFLLAPPKSSYEIGESGTAYIPLPRPARIERAGLIFTNVTPSIETPIRVLEAQEWAALSPKELASTVPYMLYYKPDVPDGTIYVWPVPSTAWEISLYYWQVIQRFTSTADVVIIPPGYQEAIEYNLALRLGDLNPNRARITPRIQMMAAKTLDWVKTVNAGPVLMKSELGAMGREGRGRYNFFSNSFGT
jgi:hypothetical protein